MDKTEKPNPSKPWCPKCNRHTPFKKKAYYLESGRGGEGGRGGRSYDYTCKHCDGTKMFVPEKMVTNKMNGLCASCVFLLLGILSALIEQDVNLFYGIAGFACLLACGGFWFNHRFLKCRKWAKENGYVEK